MEAFAALVDALVYTRSRNGKLALIADYLRATPDPDRGWALAALTDGLDFPAVKSSTSESVRLRLSRSAAASSAPQSWRASATTASPQKLRARDGDAAPAPPAGWGSRA